MRCRVQSKVISDDITLKHRTPFISDLFWMLQSKFGYYGIELGIILEDIFSQAGKLYKKRISILLSHSFMAADFQRELFVCWYLYSLVDTYDNRNTRLYK